MKRLIFKVEQKTGKLPEIAWKTVFEREVDCENVDFDDLSHILSSLRCMYFGEQYRVILICD